MRSSLSLITAAAPPGWLFPLDGDDILDVYGFSELVTHPLFATALWHPANRLTPEGEPTTSSTLKSGQSVNSRNAGPHRSPFTPTRLSPTSNSPRQ